MTNKAVELPGAVAVAAAVYGDFVGETLDPVTVLTIVFQAGDAEGFLRQSFVLDPTLAELLADHLTNPITITSEGTNQ
jgi:hypothetical protein